MRAFIWTMFAIHCFVTFVWLSELASKHFPYERKPQTQGGAVLNVVVAIAFAIWAACLLFGGAR